MQSNTPKSYQPVISAQKAVMLGYKLFASGFESPSMLVFCFKSVKCLRTMRTSTRCLSTSATVICTEDSVRDKFSKVEVSFLSSSVESAL